MPRHGREAGGEAEDGRRGARRKSGGDTPRPARTSRLTLLLLLQSRKLLARGAAGAAARWLGGRSGRRRHASRGLGAAPDEEALGRGVLWNGFEEGEQLLLLLLRVEPRSAAATRSPEEGGASIASPRAVFDDNGPDADISRCREESRAQHLQVSAAAAAAHHSTRRSGLACKAPVGRGRLRGVTCSRSCVRRRRPVWVVELAVPAQYLLEGEILGAAAEGRHADEALVDDAAQRPEVRGRVRRLVAQHLGRDVLGRADEGVLARVAELRALVLGAAKVGELHVAG